MAEIDPVVLELRANLLRYQSDLRKQATDTERQLGRQERAVQRLEKQMLKSSTAISGSLRGIAGTLGTLFTGREMVGLIDGFTRLQNSLKVAGLEGQNLERVQSQLLDLSTRYGVNIESLANLYGKATDAGRGFGASEQQILQLTEATSQALLITGTNAQQASGAILGLSQALASGTVRAEEYNQINEGGLRPLLQAAAASERFGGDINKLRAAMLDGKVSSQEFFNGILAGSQQLEGQAAKAALTVSGAFEGLTSRITVYIGQAAQISGATAALAGAMQLLADNLETIIPLLAVIGVAAFGRFAAAALAGGKALQSIAAYASIATTSLAGTALAANSAGAALLKALGGPVGVAITGITLALGAMVYAAQDSAASIEQLQASSDSAQSRLDTLRKQAKSAGVNIEALKSSADSAKSSFFELTTALNLSANAMAQVAKNAKLATLARIQLENVEARRAISQIDPRVSGIDAAAARNRRLNAAFGSKVSGYENLTNAQRLNLDEDRARLVIAKQTLATNKQNAEIIKAIPDAKFVDPDAGTGSGSSGASSGKSKKKKSGGGPSGPSAAEIEDRFQSELANITQQTLSARQSLATSAEDRAELELRAVESARTEALRSLEAEKTYSEAQKARIRDALENLAEFERERVARDRRRQIEDERQQIEEAEFNARSDALRNQYDLATTDEQRRQIARQILEAEDAYLRSKLEAVIANQDLTDAVRRQAQIELDALNASAGDRKALVEKANQGALGRYIDSISDTKSRVEEATVRKLEAVNQGITDAIASQLGVKDQFVKDLFSIFLDEVIFRPLAEALRGAQSGGGGLLSSLFGGGSSNGIVAGDGFWNVIFGSGGLFGRASGGFVAPGQTVRVNEHRGRVEGFRPTGSGTIIPLGQMNAMAARSISESAVARVQLDLSGDLDARIVSVSGPVAVEVVRGAAPSIVDAASNETMRRANRPRMPGAGR